MTVKGGNKNTRKPREYQRSPSGKPYLSRPKTRPKALPKNPNLRALAADIVCGVLQERRSLKGSVQLVQEKLDRRDDKALVKEMANGVVRHLPRLDRTVEVHAKREIGQIHPELLNILRVGVYQILFLDRVPDYAAVHECVEAAKVVNPRAGGFVNGVLRSVAEGRADEAESVAEAAGAEGLAMRHGMPIWLVRRYVKRFGAEAEAILSALAAPAKTTILFQGSDGSAAGVRLLKGAGFRVEPEGTFPMTFTVKSGNPVESEAFRKGLFYVMDPASQVPALLFPLSGRRKVLDLCAAPGGKTVVISLRLGAKGWILSTDRTPRRIRKIRDNVARMGLTNVKIARVDVGTNLPFKAEWPAVLVDAPCSSLGTLRRNPEICRQFKEEDFKRKAAVQALFLEKAASVVAPGGVLGYSVCSIEEEETESVINAFLGTHDNFEVATFRTPGWLKGLLDRPGRGRAYLLPHKHAWDGFYAAFLKRRA